MIDTVTDTVGAPIPVDAPSEVVFSLDGSRAYVASGIEEDTITVIRTTDRSVVTIPPLRTSAKWCSARTAAGPTS